MASLALAGVGSMSRLRVTVLGGGSFGTALAVIAARRGHKVVIWARNQDQVDAINATRRNPKRFKDYVLPKSISATSSVKEAMENVDLIIHAVPAQATPSFLRQHREDIPASVPLVSTSKGIVIDTEQLMSEAITEVLGDRTSTQEKQPLAYLSGPSFAAEIIKGHPMAVVVASENIETAQFIQRALSSKFFRIYTSTDVIGVEVGGAIKNPLAIGAGMASGLEYGQSTLASLITRGCAEMRKLAVAMGGKPETLAGLSGIGDLMLTSTSSQSRNFTLGYRMASEGLTCEEAVERSGQVVEGVATAKVAAKLCQKYGLSLPLFMTMAEILEGKITPADAFDIVMTRQVGSEF